MRTGGPGESTLLLLDVVDLLNAQTIAYAVIGALAASVHGAVRASLDADALISIPMSQATQLQEAARKQGFVTDLSRGDLDDPIAAVLGGPLDLVDAARAVAAAGDSLDLALLRRLAARFGRDASAALEKLLAA